MRAHTKSIQLNAGFSLMELMVAIAILAIIATIAVPSFESIIQNNRAVTLSSAFVTSLHLARSEAVKRGDSVTICPTANDTFTSCGDSTMWVNGWIVFRDPDNDGLLATASDRLAIQQSFERGTNITSAENRLTFSNTGFLDAVTANFNLTADGCVGDHARVVSISGTGRVNVAQATCSP